MGRAASKRVKDRQRYITYRQRQEEYHIREIIRGRTFFDRHNKETIQLEFGSADVGDVRLWTDPGEVLKDPYGRGSVDTVM